MADDKLVIYDLVEATPASPTDAPGRPTWARDGRTAARVRAVEVSTEVVRESLDGFLGTVQEMLQGMADTAGNYQLDTVEVAAQVGADGKVGFLGSGLGVSGQSSIKVVFKRRP